MKNLFVITLLIGTIVSTYANEPKKTRKEKKAEREAELIEQTKQLTETKAWQFDATQMNPPNGQSRQLTNSYGIVFKDDKVYSYMPYLGRAYSASYGSSESPMTFESTIEDYRVSDAKNGGYKIEFKARNKNDIIEYTFNVSASGSVSLIVYSPNRQQISYYGNLVPIDGMEQS